MKSDWIETFIENIWNCVDTPQPLWSRSKEEAKQQLKEILSQAIESARKEEREKVVKEFEWYSRHNYQTGYVQFNAKEYEDLLRKLLGKEEAK